jgi:hypothetical protein
VSLGDETARDLIADEAEAILAAGLALIGVQHVRLIQSCYLEF